MNVDLTHVDTASVAGYIEQTHKQTTAQFLLNIIPNTFIGAFSEGNVLQVLYVAVLCGFALSWLGERGKLLTDLIEVSSQMLFRIVAVVMWAAPIGAFGAIAFTVGKFGTGSLLFARRVAAQLLRHVPDLRVRRACGRSRIGAVSACSSSIRYIWEELLIVFATTSSETVLPRMIST